MKLRNMLPILTADNKADESCTDFVLSGEKPDRLTAPVSKSYLNNVALSEFGRSLTLSNTASPASFCHHVSHVAFMCRKEKVARVAAETVVARMADFNSFRCAMLESDHPSDAVRHIRPELFLKCVKPSVPTVGCGRRPDPAVVRFSSDNPGPKMGNRIFKLGWHRIPNILHSGLKQQENYAR